MANPIENKQIVEALTEIKKLGEAIEKTFKGIAENAQEFGEEAEEAVKNLDLSKTKDIETLNKIFKGLVQSVDKLTEANKVRKKASNAANKEELENLKKIAKAEKEVEKRLKEIQKEKEKKALAEIKALQKRQKEQEKANNAAIQAAKKEEREQEKLRKETEKLAKQKEALEQRTAKQAKKEKELNRAYNVQSRRLNTLRKEYKDLAVQNKENTKRGRELLANIRQLDKKLKDIDQTVGQNQRNVGDYSRAFEGLKNRLAPAALALLALQRGIDAVSAVVRKSFQLFSDFGLNISKVQAVSGATTAEIQKLEQQAKNLGGSTQFTASQVAELQLNLSKLGFTAKQIQAATGSILDFAVATDSDLGQAAEVVASTLNAYNLEAAEAARVSDVAAKAFNSTALDIEKFSTAIAIVGPAAEASGISIEKTTAILGKIVDAGVDASSAGSALRNVFIDIADKGLSLDDALSQISESQNKLTTANELFGKRGAVVAKIIADNVDEIDKLDQAFINAEGSAADAAKIIGNNLSGDTKKLQSAFEALLLSAGPLNTFFRGIVQSATRLLGLFVDLRQPFKNIVNENIELSRSTRDLVDTSQSLLSTYEDLQSQTELNAAEKEELKNVTADLIFTFGNSVASIDDETGAYVLNVEAIKEKIRAEQILQSEAVRTLLAEQKRLEFVVRQSKTVDDTLDRIRRNFENVSDLNQPDFFTALNLAEEAETVQGYSLALAELSKKLDIPKEINERIIDALAQADPLIIGDAEGDLEKVNKELESLGVNLDEIANRTSKIKKELGGEKISDLLDPVSTESEDQQTEEEINKELFNNRLLDIDREFSEATLREREKRNKRISEIVNNEQLTEEQKQNQTIQAEEDFQNKLLDLEIKAIKQRVEARQKFGFDTLDLQNQLSDLELKQIQDKNKKIRDEEQKNQDELLEIRKRALQDLQQATQFATQILNEISSSRIAQIDSEIDAISRREDQLRDAFNNAPKLAQKSLTELDNQRQELEDRRAEELERQARRELLVAGAQVLAQSGSIQEAANNLLQLKGLVSGLLVGFHDGGYTGKKGEYEIAGVTHGQEFVNTKKQVDEYDMHGWSASDFDAAVKSGHFQQFTDPKYLTYQPVPINNGSTSDNSVVVDRLEKVEKAIYSTIDYSPQHDLRWIEQNKEMEYIIKTKHKTDRLRRKSIRY